MGQARNRGTKKERIKQAQIREQKKQQAIRDREIQFQKERSLFLSKLSEQERHEFLEKERRIKRKRQQLALLWSSFGLSF